MDIVSLLPSHIVFERGMDGPAVIGACTELTSATVGFTAENFRQNRAFVELLHEVIGTRGPLVAGLQEAARQHGDGAGWISAFDARTRIGGENPSTEDLIGQFAIEDGAVVPGSYKSNPDYRLLSARGWFRLDPEFRDELMKRLTGEP